MEKENSTFTTTITSSSPWEIIRREVPDWDDEMTSIARFKAFSGQRSDWEPRYMFWKDLIVKVAKGLGICTVKSSDVKNVWFNRGGLTPLCIDHVLIEMYSDGDFILEGDLMDPRSGRMYQLFRRFGRALGISNSSVLQGDGDDLLILRTLLEDRAIDISKKLSESHWNVNCIIMVEKFEKLCRTSEEALAIMSYLIQCRKALYFTIKKEEFIEGLKISLLPSAQQVSNISSLDYNLLQLIWTTERLHQQLAVIDRRWAMSRKSTIVSIKSGNKQAALRHMKQMKLFSESREKCTTLLDRVEEVITLISDAESTKKVSEAIQIGAIAMKENKLSIDEVHKHLEELDESISHQKQVDQVLGSVSGTEDEEELEDELTKLELELLGEDEDAILVTPTKNNQETTDEALTECFSKLQLEAV
ncbi:SNF7 family protein [Zostera marina]|uniref:SNF7 family protein n=1 Tax=Zostera marina TaxID=29655 RepID=A0A0K9NYG2_ZOSMR|nr:SNF7 family protein [Zostera marina]